jgi:hypothetical protein
MKSHITTGLSNLSPLTTHTQTSDNYIDIIQTENLRNALVIREMERRGRIAQDSSAKWSLVGQTAKEVSPEGGADQTLTPPPVMSLIYGPLSLHIPLSVSRFFLRLVKRVRNLFFESGRCQRFCKKICRWWKIAEVFACWCRGEEYTSPEVREFLRKHPHIVLPVSGEERRDSCHGE